MPLPGAVVGLISPPRWASPSVIEFPGVVAAPVLVQQTFPDLPGFDYQLGSIARAHDAVCASARMLGEAGCRAVAMEGTPFAWAGLDGEAAARERTAEIGTAAGVPGVTAATAIIDALRALGASRVALCPTYYPADWRDGWRRFVEACRLEVSYCRTLEDEGLVGPIATVEDHGWNMAPDLIRRAVAQAAADGSSDAIVVTGAGCRTSLFIRDLERIAGRPVVGADTAVFWWLAGAADLPLWPDALGTLTGAGAPSR